MYRHTIHFLNFITYFSVASTLLAPYQYLGYKHIHCVPKL